MTKKKKKHESVSQTVFRTKIWKSLILCCGISAVVSILFMLLMYYGMSHYVVKHIADSEAQREETDQLMSELQAFISQRNLSISNTKEIRQWEMKKGVKIHFTGTKETIAYIEGIQQKYENTVISIVDENNPTETYEVRFKDGVVVSYPELKKVMRYYNISFILSAVFSLLLFVFILLRLVRKRIYYLIRLRDEIRILEAGNLDYSITVNGRDELAEIGYGMNNMRRNVLKKIQTEREAITANHELITAMSHDLRTPLTKQIGYLEIMYRRKYAQEEELRDYIEKARNNAFIMKDTTDKLFRYFLAFGEQDNEHKQCEIDGKALLNTVLKEQIAYIISQGFVVSFEEITENFRLRIDPEEFARIFDNVFHNMKKYGEPSIPVHITHIMQGEDFLLMIQNGVKEDTSKVESTKIGLKIVEKVMKSMDGSMEVLNDGQYFIIQLVFRMIE